jgi:hypothetical protein
VTVPLGWADNASSFWIILLLVSGRTDNGPIRIEETSLPSAAFSGDGAVPLPRSYGRSCRPMLATLLDEASGKWPTAACTTDKLRIEQGKGRKDRYAMLSPVLLELTGLNPLNKWFHLQSRVVDAVWRPRRGSAVSPPADTGGAAAAAAAAAAAIPARHHDATQFVYFWVSPKIVVESQSC